MTALVPSPADSPTAPWSQRRDEPTEYYAHFREWLRLIPRPTPAQCNAVELAAQFDWVARAQAYDTACDLLLEVPSGSLQANWQHTVGTWGQLVAIEAKKLLRQSMSSRSATLGPQEQLAFVRQIADIEMTLNEQRQSSADQSYDLDRLEPEERRLVDELLEKARVK